MSQLTQPFSSRDTILALITPPLVPAPPPPAGAERLVAKRGAYTGVPFYAAVSATLGLQRLYDLALDFGTRCDGLQWSYSPFEQPPCGHVADDPVDLVVGRGLDDAHKRSISYPDTTAKYFLLSFQLHHVFEMRDDCSFEQRDRLFRRCRQRTASGLDQILYCFPPGVAGLPSRPINSLTRGRALGHRCPPPCIARLLASSGSCLMRATRWLG